MKRLAIIGAGHLARTYAERCRELGIESHCFAWADGALARDAADVFHDVSVTEVDRIADACRELGVDGVVATTELTVYPAAYVAARIGTPGIDPEVAAVITDKFRNRQATRHVEGLRHPAYALFDEGDPGCLDAVSFPAVVKPTSEGGKRGVTVVHDRGGLEEALAYARREKKEASGIVVESFIPEGVECSVESISVGGETRVVQVTEKWSSGAPHCVELAHHQPADLPVDVRRKVEDVVSRAVTAVGVSDGPCHTEVKIVDGEVWLVEFNARPGGGGISYPLTELSTGYPYITAIIRCAMGELELPDPRSFERNYAGICFVVEQTSWLKPVFDSCAGEPWCYERQWVSDELKTLTHNSILSTNYFIYFDRERRPDFVSRPGSSCVMSGGLGEAF